MQGKTDMDVVLGADGIIAKNLPGYEHRKEQISLSQKIYESISNERHLIAEGPTGVGKSLAYLAAAILSLQEKDEDEGTDNRVIVSTSTIALQEQLFFKDLPFLANVFEKEGKPFSYCMVKGRNNYLCWQAYQDRQKEIAQMKLGLKWDKKSDNELSGDVTKRIIGVSPQVEGEILKWAATTKTGDKSELCFVPDDHTWGFYSVTASDCLGKDCVHRNRCFAESAKKSIRGIDVIVSNYSFLFSSIKVREEVGADIVLPPARIIVCDEAHELADKARDFFGWDLSEYTINKSVKQWNRLSGQLVTFLGQNDRREEAKKFDSFSSDLNSALERFTSRISEWYGNPKDKEIKRIKKRDELGISDLAGFMAVLVDGYRCCREFLAGNSEEEGKFTRQMKWAKALEDNIRDVSELADSNSVYWVEKFGKKGSLRIVKRTIDVAPVLRKSLFDKTGSVVLTSATLATGSGSTAFEFVKKEVGCGDNTDFFLGQSPFDYKRNGLIVASRPGGTIPLPNDPGFPAAIASASEKLILESDGRALFLFTSYKNLRFVAEHLRGTIGDKYTLLVQGDKPRHQLLEEFKADVHSVLLGTSSFWVGVDAPGETCSLVVIDKIPFPSPADPIIEVLSERAEASGEKSAFFSVSLPRAALQLKQGVGRLIRRKDDRGVVVLFDTRFRSKGYGATLLRILPPFRTVSKIKKGQIGSWISGSLDAGETDE